MMMMLNKYGSFMFVPIVTNQLTLATMPISRFRHVSGTFPARSRLVFGTVSGRFRYVSATLFRSFSGNFPKSWHGRHPDRNCQKNKHKRVSRARFSGGVRERSDRHAEPNSRACFQVHFHILFDRFLIVCCLIFRPQKFHSLLKLYWFYAILVFFWSF